MTLDVPPRALDALRLIVAAIEREGFPPTVRELMAEMGLKSTNGVNEHLQRLAGSGLILRRGRGRARAWVVTPAGHMALDQHARAA